MEDTTKQRALLIERCKTYGHAWYEQDVDSAYKPMFGLPVWFECERCGTQRRELWNIHGELASRTYVHPRDWKQHSRRMSKADHRVELMKRMPGFKAFSRRAAAAERRVG